MFHSTFKKQKISVKGGDISVVTGGFGPMLLMIHGYPQSGLMWHKVANELKDKFTLVIPDLRGYGDSFKPLTKPDNSQMSFRAMADDLVELMEGLGAKEYFVTSHDRGARVAHRMALDHPDRVSKMMLLDILPTLWIYENIDQRLATGYFHWLFLPQPYPLPEKMIAPDPEMWLSNCLGKWSLGDQQADSLEHIFPADVKAVYLEHFSDPTTLHCTTEDYRAGAGIDLEHDRKSRAQNVKINCETFVLWGAKGLFGGEDTVDIWQRHSNKPVTGHAVDSGHFVAEESPDVVIRHCLDFFG